MSSPAYLGAGYSCTIEPAGNHPAAENRLEGKKGEIGANSESVAALNLPIGKLFRALRVSRAAFYKGDLACSQLHAASSYSPMHASKQPGSMQPKLGRP